MAKARRVPPGSEQPGAGLSLLVLSEAFERVHYALVLASSAAAIGRPVRVFFAGPSVRALCAAADGGASGWRRLPAAGGAMAGTIDDAYADKGIATFEVLLDACVELGVRFMVCEMALRAAGLDRADLRADVPIAVAGAVTLLAEAGTVLSL